MGNVRFFFYLVLVVLTGCEKESIAPPATVAQAPTSDPAAPPPGTCGSVVDCASQAVKAAQDAQKAAEQGYAQFRASLAGAVVAFDGVKCPPGWSEYAQAQGRFIRGIDRSGKIDPDGVRAPGSLQKDDLLQHVHNIQNLDTGSYHGGDEGDGDHFGGRMTKATELNAGSSETRPKNVALLFCILQ